MRHADSVKLYGDISSPTGFLTAFCDFELKYGFHGTVGFAFFQVVLIVLLYLFLRWCLQSSRAYTCHSRSTDCNMHQQRRFAAWIAYHPYLFFMVLVHTPFHAFLFQKSISIQPDTLFHLTDLNQVSS